MDDLKAGDYQPSGYFDCCGHARWRGHHANCPNALKNKDTDHDQA